MQTGYLQQFSLVGGTALALKYGHRISVDLDLFSNLPFDNSEIIAALESEFGEAFLLHLNREKFGIFCYIHEIKVDIIKHPFILLQDLELVEGIRMYHTADLAAMKVNAVLGRGKKKDFWDIFELLHHYTLPDIIQFYNDKFPNQQLMIGIPHALTYFDDAEESEDPVSLKGQTWKSVKKFIQQKVSEFLR
jgi:predicted nucleotidyltransferase component of viral defense system